MTDLWQIKPLYTGGLGMPGTNTIFASTNDTDVDDLRTALNAFYTTYATNHMSNQITVTVPSAGDKIASTSGQLVGLWSSGTDTVHAGAIGNDRTGLALQLLVQLRTDLVVSGRILHGRVFLPGVTEPDSDNGKPGTGIIASVLSAADDAFTGRCCVFSPTHNQFATVTSVAVWTQFAVLRSRRD